MRPEARGLDQYGGPPGWLEESDQAGVILCVMDVLYRLPFPYRTQLLLHIVNVPNIRHALRHARKACMARYSSRPMPYLSGIPYLCLRSAVQYRTARWIRAIQCICILYACVREKKGSFSLLIAHHKPTMGLQKINVLNQPPSILRLSRHVHILFSVLYAAPCGL
jgi:hypothetical protein